MIKAMVLDVDGVLVGEKVGYNSPNPHTDVLSALKHIHAQHIPIILCTGKPHYAIADIINDAHLTNPHITASGAVVIDPIDHKIMQAHVMDRAIVEDIVDSLQKHSVYTELYTVDEYIIEAGAKNDLTEIHGHVLQRMPRMVPSIKDVIRTQDIVRIMPIADDETHMEQVKKILAPFSDRVSMSWGLHPIANPHQFCGITTKGISKRQTTLDVLSSLSVSPEDTLGVGDSTSDWKYMELCGYIATLENGQKPLREYVQNRGTSGYIGAHVDRNGILDVFSYFHLLDTSDSP